MSEAGLVGCRIIPMRTSIDVEKRKQAALPCAAGALMLM